MDPSDGNSNKEVSGASLLIFGTYPESGIDVGLAPYALLTLLLSWKQDFQFDHSSLRRHLNELKFPVKECWITDQP
jgi:hypothetical protein